MSFVVNGVKKENNTGSSNPLEQNTSTPENTDQMGEESTVGSSAPPISSNQNNTSTSQSSVPAPKPASSGMFTNLQKYVQSHASRAGNIGGAGARNVEGQTQQIANQVQNQKNQLSSTLEDNKATINTAYDSAGNVFQPPTSNDPRRDQIENINNRAIEPYRIDKSIQIEPGLLRTGGRATQDTNVSVPLPKIEDSKIGELSNLYQGNVTGLQNVGQLDVGAQEQRAKALANLAGRLGQESATRNLLRDTFTQGNRAYTQGQSQLDNLILGGNQQALEAMKQRAEGATQRVVGQQGLINQARQDIDTQRFDVDQTLKNRSEDFRKSIDEQAQGIVGSAQARMDEFTKQSDELQSIINRATSAIGQDGDEVRMIQGGITQDELMRIISPEQIQQQKTALVSDMENDLNIISNPDKMRRENFQSYISTMQKYYPNIDFKELQRSTGAGFGTMNQLATELAANLQQTKQQIETDDNYIIQNLLNAANAGQLRGLNFNRPDVELSNFTTKEEADYYNALQKIANREELAIRPEAVRSDLALNTQVDLGQNKGLFKPSVKTDEEVRALNYQRYRDIMDILGSLGYGIL